MISSTAGGTKTSMRRSKGLEELLIEAGLVTADQLESAIQVQKKSGKKLSDILVDQGVVDSQDMLMMRSIQLNVPIIDLTRHQVQPDAMRLISVDLAKKYDAIPLDTIEDALVVVMSDPEDIEAVGAFTAASGMKIEVTIASLEDIRNAIAQLYRSNAEIEEQISRIKAGGKQADEGSLSAAAVAQTPVVRTVDLLLSQGVKDRASDIHIEPQPTRLRIRYRIDGVLRDVMDLPLNTHPLILSRIKILADMNIAERRRPQDGQFSMTLDSGKEVDIRVATTDTTYGEMAVLRVLDKSLSLFALSDIGFLRDALERYQKMLHSPFGMIMICGPTGSGKTTTLYASINQLDRTGTKIMTIEDPVEYRFVDINQIQVNARAGLTFASGLRALMRLDPDIILVGETRDEETAGIATQAALTGHLMLTSIHANDSVGALFRLVHLGIEPFLICSALLGVVSQRMVRKICPHCAVKSDISLEQRVVYEQEMGVKQEKFSIGRGCTFCSGTGYHGRMGVFEVLLLSERIGQMLLANAPAPEIRTQAIKEGMVTMRRDGIVKVKDGITTMSEVFARLA